MLEEALQSNTIPPSEIAKSFSIFLKQDFGFGDTTTSTLVDKRFTNVVILLCKRLFTDDAWLSSLHHWDMCFNKYMNEDGSAIVNVIFGMISNLLYCTENQLEKDKLVKLLSIDKTNVNITLMNVFLYHGLRYDYNKKFDYLLDALPKPTQKVITEGILFKEKSVDGNNMIVERIDTSPRMNAKRLVELMGNIVPPTMNVRKDSSPKGSPFRAGTPSRWSGASNIMSSPLRSSPKLSPSPSPAEPKTIVLNMLEYYLMSFISFPLQNSSKNSALLKLIQQHMSNYMYGSTVYTYLFKMYLSHFLSQCRVNNSPFVTTTTINSDVVSKPSELFLRIIIEYWLDGENTLYITSEAMQRSSMHYNRDDKTFPLNTAFDLVQSTSPQLDYTPNPLLVSNCVQIVIKCLLLDYVSSYLHAIRSTTSIFDDNILSPTQLTPAMKIIQPSLFNHIRMLIKYAPMVQYGNYCPFLDIVDLWLLWLEPWNVETVTSRYGIISKYAKRYFITSNNTDIINDELTLNKPSVDTPSKYTSQMKDYIASNYHFYTHILSLFIRRARELDFSKVSSITTLQRVIRVFSPYVVSELYALSNETPSPNGMNQHIHALKEEHNNRLGDYCPANPHPTLFASCVTDIESLLQNVVREYYTLRQSPYAKFAPTTYSSLPTEESMHQLAYGFKGLIYDQVSLDLQQIFFVPTSDASAQPESISSSTISSIYETIKSKLRPDPVESNQPERDGIYLTQKGREQIFNGTKQCQPYEYKYIGDPMKAKVQSYEISLLVDATLRISFFLNNAVFGIKEDITIVDIMHKERSSLDELLKEHEMYLECSFRFNFRFLADWRNVVFLYFVFSVLKLLV